jgi:hypothetical protein
MSNEAAIGSAEASDGGGHPGGGRRESASLQSRAKFLENWSWLSVTEINGRLCDRGQAQRGVNTETYKAVEQDWETKRLSELTLLETFQFLKSCHRSAPFLFSTATPSPKLAAPLPTRFSPTCRFNEKRKPPPLWPTLSLVCWI